MNQSTGTHHNLEVVEDESVVLIRTVFVVLILIVSLVGNTAALFTFILASKRTINPFRSYLISMSAYGLLECSLNISIATGFSIEGLWVFTKFMQGFNACFLQLQSIGILLTITVMSIDRFVAVAQGKNYYQESFNHKANYAVLYTWFHAFVFSLPLLFQNESIGLTVRSFTERNACGLTEFTTAIYSLSILIICFVIPIVTSAIFLRLVFAKIKQLDKRRLNMPYYSTHISQSKTCTHTAKFIVLLFALYITTKGPFIAVDFLTQFNFTSAFIPVNQSISNTSLEFEVDGKKFYYQTCLTWLSFCFSAIYPLAMFSWFKEHRNRLKDNCCCSMFPNQKIVNKKVHNARLHQRNKFNLSTANNNNSASLNEDYKKSTAIEKTLNQKTATKVPIIYQNNRIPENKHLPGPGFRIPVLYAAADGLHLVASNSQTARPSSGVQNIRNGSSGYAGSESDRGRSAKSVYNYYSQVERESETKQSKLNPSRFFKRLYSGATVNAENFENRVVEARTDTSRPTSVVDKRLDVKGSIKSDDETYFQSSDVDEDYATESELNQSANSRTLILPTLDKNEEKNSHGLLHTASHTQTSAHVPLSLTNLEKHNKANSSIENNLPATKEKCNNEQDVELDYLKSFQSQNNSKKTSAAPKK